VCCNNHDILDGYKLPPPLPTKEEPEPEIPDPEYSDHPSLLTDAEKTRVESLDKSYNAEISLLNGGTYLSTFEYVVLLFKRGDAASVQRAETILKTIISAQVTDPGNTHYGNWPWGIDRTIGDRNPPVFFARRMLGELWDLQDRMLPSMVNTFKKSCELLVNAAERRWDVEVFAANRAGVAYTNVYSMYVETLTLAGIRFDDSRLKQLAQDKWKVFYDNFTKYGIDEFLSRDYDNITFNALWSMHGLVTGEQQDQVKEVMDYIFILKQAVTHPKLYTPVVGMSRDDRKFVTGSDARSDFQNPNLTPVGYVVPDDVKTLRSRTAYPFEVNGRAGAYTFTFNSYQEEKAAMGSMTGWGSYYSQQVHCMASIGTSTSARTTLFVPGSYIHVNGFTDQKKLTALMVYNRLPTLWHRDQWKGNQNDISSTLFDFGVGLSSQWKVLSSESGKVVLNSTRGFHVYLFPYILDSNNQIKGCSLNQVKRTSTSEKYHAADSSFDELLFPSDALWFGVYIKIVPDNTSVTAPTISFNKNGENMVFSTDEGHKLEIGKKDGVSVQIRDVDPLSLPRYEYK